MTAAQVFLPNDKPLNIRLLWWAALTLPIVVPSVRLDFTADYLVPEAIISLLLVFVFVLPARVPEQISISIPDHVLEYTYHNCWGCRRTVTMDLHEALAKYRHTSFGRLLRRWRLALYASGRSRVVLSQDSKGGFSKEQLDEMLHLIEDCGADCHLCKQQQQGQQLKAAI